MKKRRLKVKFMILFAVLILALVLVFIFFKDGDIKKSEKNIKANVSEDINLVNLKKEKYYIDKNLERYLSYMKINPDFSLEKIVRNVNVNLDKKQYEDTFKTNVNDGVLMLVNKYYYLTEDYEPNDLVTLTAKYNKGTNSKMRKEAANAFMKMADAAMLDNIVIKNASGYRSYNYQVSLYDNYVKKDGKEAADTYSARPGFSEHQTGFVSDINIIDTSFENTDDFLWLHDNAYKYGFILRFPKDKEDVTGYQYEPWHYRYVGKKAAKTIHDEELTLEEYYAYYIEK